MQCEKCITYKEDDHISTGTSKEVSKIGRNPSHTDSGVIWPLCRGS